MLRCSSPASLGQTFGGLPRAVQRGVAGWGLFNLPGAPSWHLPYKRRRILQLTAGKKMQLFLNCEQQNLEDSTEVKALMFHITQQQEATQTM